MDAREWRIRAVVADEQHGGNSPVIPLFPPPPTLSESTDIVFDLIAAGQSGGIQIDGLASAVALAQLVSHD